MSEFEFPEVHETETVKVEGKLYRQPVNLEVCDFCYDRRVCYAYDCEDFVLPPLTPGGSPFGSSAEWAACSACSELIEASDVAGLLARASRSWEAQGAVAPRADLLKGLTNVFRTFLQKRQGERKLIARDVFYSHFG